MSNISIDKNHSKQNIYSLTGAPKVRKNLCITIKAFISFKLLKTSLILIASIFVVMTSILASEILKSNLRFSHKTHYDQNIRCERCHVLNDMTAVKSTSSGWMPLGPSRILKGTKAKNGLETKEFGDLPKLIIDGEDIAESEKTIQNNNASPSDLASIGLHDNATNTPSMVQSFGRPPEKTCLQCHPRQRHGKMCGLCHLGPPKPTERTRKRLSKGVRFPHEAHKNYDCLDCHQHIPDWENLDGTMQDLSMAGCLKCHTGVKVKKNCTLCHDPTPWPSDHVRNFSEKHGIAYRANPQSCRTCHEDSSCVACHAQRPRSHTLAWVSRRHGLTASSRPESCKACHSDPEVCLRCHR